MNKPIITVEGLGKRYYLSHRRRSDSLRDSLSQGFRGLLGRVTGSGEAAAAPEEFWAIRNLSFQVNEGDVIGIIGRNGAGKSTLLKLLSRISEPTLGRAVIRGRVASLLEVGTGFHPELTGRENVFLNGAILGMSRTEIPRKFDEIVAFAEVERFLDTQVKHYSSGMYVRLAFAVAAHLEPEILIVDEVLAVGDADFQRKCLRKMNDVTRNEGRTILFVSHQLASVQQLCNRVILLNRGQITHDTDTATGLAAYNRLSGEQTHETATLELGTELKLTAMEFTPAPVRVFDDLNLRLQLTARADCRIHDICLLVYGANGQRVAIADLRQAEQSYTLVAGETLTLAGQLRRLALIPGTYTMGLYLRTTLHVGDHHSIRSIEVLPAVNSQVMRYAAEYLGTVAMDSQFSATVARLANSAPAAKNPA